MTTSSEWLRHVGLDIGSEGGDSQAFYDVADELERLEDELSRLRLTDAEREAIGVAIQCVVAAKAQRHPEEEESQELLHKTAATLRGLLERTK